MQTRYRQLGFADVPWRREGDDEHENVKFWGWFFLEFASSCMFLAFFVFLIGGVLLLKALQVGDHEYALTLTLIYFASFFALIFSLKVKLGGKKARR